ncbi:MAG TPA: hypothetical protein VHD76_15655 [Bryobacteraceae bacterium]|jgi:hypothetical protein|nr:hypothetical protein [Bryobacteraceae bacterium]
MNRIVFTAWIAALGVAGQDFHQPAPPAPKDFAVMAWGDSPSDAQQLQWMREAGFNISGFCKPADLEKVRAAGLSCFVSFPPVGGVDLLHLPPENELRARFAELKKQIAGNPAATGVYLRDEPDAPSMPGLGVLSKLLRESMPDQWPYVNLFPARVSPKRLGVPNYETYVRMLVDTVGQPFLTYDDYSLVGGEMLDSYYTNLEIVRRLGLETKTPFWHCILSNSHFNYMEPSDATFALQVYSTLAYGGRGIQYFTYFAPNVGNYRKAAVDQFGNRTATWDMVRLINNQINALAPTLIHLRSTGVYHYPDVPEQAEPLSASKLIASVEMTQRFVRPPAAGRFLIGEFEDNGGRPYFLIVNKDLNNSFQFKIHLKQEGHKLIRISPYSGKEEPFGREMDWLAPGAGILFRVE